MSHGSQFSDLVGLILHDSYRITRKIGEGGMGVVYEAFHIRLTKKRFAIKFLHPVVVEMPEVYARFRREAEITTELGHPNIINVLDFNQTEQGQPYIVMEYLEGENLGVRVRRAGRLSVPEVIQVMGESASALHAAHEKGIVHRDMKPENIFLAGPLDGPFTTKILDFGISKILHSKSVITRDQAVFGTPYYMSPEQAEGMVSDIDARTDIFAMGSICYQILTGKLPFDAPTLPGVIYQVCHRDPKPVSELVEEIPDDIDLVLSRALAKNKDHRYQRIEDFAADLATTAVKQQIRYGQPQPISIHVPGIPTGVEGVISRALAKNREERYLEIEDFAADLAASIAGARPADDSHPGIDARRVASPQAPTAEMSVTSNAASGIEMNDGDDMAGAITTLSGATGETTAAPTTHLIGRRRRALFTVVFTGLALLVGGGLMVLLKTSSPNTSSPNTSSPNTSSPNTSSPNKMSAAPKPRITEPVTTPATPKAPKMVRIKLEVTPPDARVTLDGVITKSNPLILPSSGAQHRLRVEAESYETKEEIFVASRSQTLRVALARIQKSTEEPAPQPKVKKTKKVKRFRFDDL